MLAVALVGLIVGLTAVSAEEPTTETVTVRVWPAEAG